MHEWLFGAALLPTFAARAPGRPAAAAAHAWWAKPGRPESAPDAPDRRDRQLDEQIHAMRPGPGVCTATPLSPRCHRALATAAHACLGISPFNSYFSTARITHLVRWAASTFRSFHLFVPDVPAAYTLEALGYPPDRARHKAQRQANYLRNKILRALQSAQIDHPETRILDWASLTGNTHYGSLLRDAHELFTGHAGFRAACLDASHWVLDKRLPAETAPTTDQLTLAARYFLAELPLFTDTAGIVGTESSVFCYHQAVRFLHRLYRHELPWKPSPRQGFAVLHHDAVALTDTTH